jgi:hypothetical protein
MHLHAARKLGELIGPPVMILLLLRGCSMSGREDVVPVNALHAHMTVEYYVNYAFDLQRDYAADSPETAQVRQIVNAKRGRWKAGSLSYAPGVIVKFPSIRLNFQRRLLVAEFKNKSDKPVQFVAPLKPEEFADIAAMKGKSKGQREDITQIGED